MKNVLVLPDNVKLCTTSEGVLPPVVRVIVPDNETGVPVLPLVVTAKEILAVGVPEMVIVLVVSSQVTLFSLITTQQVMVL